jgi:hypothetical protein
MEDNRKKWVQPQLIVLGRGTPEENVLAGCKITTMSGRSANRTKCKKTFNKCTGTCSSTTAAS